MFKGIIDEITWERVFINICGSLRKIETKEEEEELFRIRNQIFAHEPERNAEKRIRTAYEKGIANMRKIIGDSYDPDEPYFFLRTQGYLQAHLLHPTFTDDGRFHIRLNVTNFQNRDIIPEGTFEISVFHGGTDYALITTVDIARDQMEISRPFVFNKNMQCYVITVSTGTNEMDPVFRFRSYLFSRKRHRKFDLERIIREARDVTIKWLIRRYYDVLYTFVPRNGKKILFATEARGNLQGNLEAIHNGMIERGLDKEYQFRYSFRKAAGEHSSARSWAKVMTLVATSDIILIDDYAPFLNWLTIGPKTKLIQVWHAGVGFKSVGFCRFGLNGSPRLDSGHRQYDYMITGSTSLKKIYSEVFGIEEEAIIPTGLPRIDALLDEEAHKSFVEQFYKDHPDLKEKKLILFAPTFRGMGQRTAHYPYDLLDMKRIYDFCGDEYVFLFKMHPFLIDVPEIPEKYRDRIRDFSSFPNINDLLRVTDLLITDYSSVIYEYSLFRRPMLFFAFDKDEYSTIRGFQSDYDTFAPGKICTTFDEMEAAIRTGDFEQEKVEKFVAENFDHVDTHSTDRFIDWLTSLK